MSITVYLELKKFIEKNNYICPNPTKWLELYTILQKIPRHNNELKLEIPLIGSHWDFSSTPEKRKRFMAQLEYALKNGSIAEADKLLRSLDENEWLMG